MPHRLAILSALAGIVVLLATASPGPIPPAAFAGDPAAATTSFVMKVGGPPGIDDALDPAGIASDGTYAYVIDPRTNRLGKWRVADLSWVAGTGEWGSGNDQFAGPMGVATDGRYVWVADTGNNRIVKLRASDLSFVAAMGTAGGGTDQFRSPAGIAVRGSFLYVADTGNHRIVKRRASNLTFVAAVGRGGTGTGRFSSPRAWPSTVPSSMSPTPATTGS